MSFKDLFTSRQVIQEKKDAEFSKKITSEITTRLRGTTDYAQLGHFVDRLTRAIEDNGNKRTSSVTNYPSKLSLPCRDCGSRAHLTVVEEKGLDGGLVKSEEIVIECPECDWGFNIASTRIGARFLVQMFDELEVPEE